MLPTTHDYVGEALAALDDVHLALGVVALLVVEALWVGMVVYFLWTGTAEGSDRDKDTGEDDTEWPGGPPPPPP